MENLKEYIITLKDKKFLDEFYNDMEMLCHGNKDIPERMVECCKRRKISRSTHYRLNSEEADIIKKDPRVLSVELHPNHLNIRVKRQTTQYSYFWDKNSFMSNDDKNWGLLRCVNGEQIPGWGIDGVSNQSAEIKLTSSGKNVDVVIVDGFFYKDHPEYKENSDGSGNSRVIQYNWFQHNPEVTGETIGEYSYDNIVDENDSSRTSNNNHGAHVAGTVAGNTQGWARDANIYNINPYSTDINQVDTFDLIDYIREFHRTKPINPETGVKNPTITNNSWGFSYGEIPIEYIQAIKVRGDIYTGNITYSLLKEKLKIKNISKSIVGAFIYDFPARVSGLDADIQDAIDEGILFVGAAGNESFFSDVEGGLDYDNYIQFIDSSILYYARGSSPGSSPGVISVGSIGPYSQEYKSYFSNSGPRVDIYAPGHYIASPYNTDTGINDPRDSQYFLNKISGTSMASPQVCGVLACALENYPDMNQNEALQYLKHYSKSNQISNLEVNIGTYLEVDINTVCYGNNKFVAAGGDGLGSVSSDGFNWEILPEGNSDGMLFGGPRESGDLLGEYSILDVSYLNDKYFAVGAGGKASYSTDGINWISLTPGENTGIKFGIPEGFGSALSNSARSSAYGNSKYVTVGSNGKASYSDDGINWTSLTPGENTGIKFGTSTCNKIKFLNGKFYTVGTGGKASYSTDGINWISLTPGENTGMKFGISSIYSISYGNNTYVAVGDSGKASYSSDGVNWTALNPGDNSGIKFGIYAAIEVIFADNKFIVVGYGGKASYSTDGINWTSLIPGENTGIKFGTSDAVNDIAYDGSKFVAVGWGGKSSYSYDGINWQSYSSVEDYVHYNIRNSENSYLFYFKERKDEGNLFPKINIKIRPASGMTFPRQRIKFIK